MPDEMSETTREQMVEALRKVLESHHDANGNPYAELMDAMELADRLPSPSACGEAHEVTECVEQRLELYEAALDDPDPQRAYDVLGDCISDLREHVRARLQQASEPPPATTGCPCTLIAPCSEQCSCAKPHMSGGCSRCAIHGSLEQRRTAARRIAGMLDTEPAPAVDWVSHKMRDPEFAAGVARVEAEEATVGHWTREAPTEAGCFLATHYPPSGGADDEHDYVLMRMDAGYNMGGLQRWSLPIQLPPPPREPGEESPTSEPASTPADPPE